MVSIYAVDGHLMYCCRILFSAVQTYTQTTAHELWWLKDTKHHGTKRAVYDYTSWVSTQSLRRPKW